MKRQLSILLIALSMLMTATAIGQSPEPTQPSDATMVASDSPTVVAGEPTVTTTEGPSESAAVASDTKNDGNAESAVSVADLAEQAQKIAEDWKKLGWMGGVIAIIGMLILMLRFKPIDVFLEDKKLKWIKPYISIGLGVLGGFFAALIGGAIWHQALIAGLIAGAAVPGFHQVLTGANKDR
jgi:hypothetical protein